MPSKKRLMQLCAIMAVTIATYWINRKLIYEALSENSRISFHHELTSLPRILYMKDESGSPIVTYNTYDKSTIIPPFFHQIWITTTGPTGMPREQIQSCRDLHSGSRSDFIDGQRHTIHWQHKLWENSDLEELFMFNSTIKQSLAFGHSMPDQRSLRSHLKRFFEKHSANVHSSLQTNNFDKRQKSVAQERLYAKLGVIIYQKFQLNESTENLLQSNKSHMNFLLKLTDIFRIFILLLFGGVYVDADTFCMKSFSPLLSIPHHSVLSNLSKAENETYADTDELYSCFASYENEKQRGELIGNSVLASAPDCNFLFRLICEYLITEPHYSEYRNSNMHAWITSGPQLITNYKALLLRQKQSSYFRIYPSYVFYPIHYTDKAIIDSFRSNVTIIFNYIRMMHPSSFTIQLFSSTVKIL
jgi:hypothetical protein